MTDLARLHRYADDGSLHRGTARGLSKMISEVPIGRIGRPDEMANAVLWLYSDAFSFTVGHALIVDGGPTLQ